jgi:hypothetical protein
MKLARMAGPHPLANQETLHDAPAVRCYGRENFTVSHPMELKYHAQD